jgi:hypothetical protein
MIDLMKLGEYGVAILALLVVIMLVDFIRKRFRESSPGNRRVEPEVFGCPNKVEGLADTLKAITKTSGEQFKLTTEAIKIIQHNGEGIDNLVRSHAPVDGREQWKFPSRMETIMEDMSDGIKELVVLTRKNGK